VHHTHLQRPQVPGLWIHCRPSTLREPNVGSLADGRAVRGGVAQGLLGRCLTDLTAAISSCGDPHAPLPVNRHQPRHSPGRMRVEVRPTRRRAWEGDQISEGAALDTAGAFSAHSAARSSPVRGARLCGRAFRAVYGFPPRAALGRDRQVTPRRGSVRTRLHRIAHK
jgi:hypothetical protein